MRKEKKHLVLDGDVTDGLAPFLDDIGMSLSGFIRFLLAQTYAQFTGIDQAVNLKKPLSEINLGDIVKFSKVMQRSIKKEKTIDLTDAMTAEELAAQKE